jgi:hypothetical protein
LALLERCTRPPLRSSQANKRSVWLVSGLLRTLNWGNRRNCGCCVSGCGTNIRRSLLLFKTKEEVFGPIPKTQFFSTGLMDYWFIQSIHKV